MTWADPVNDGVFFETNPHRASGRYLFPEPTASAVVVMTTEGVTMSDPAYLNHVIVVVRPWRGSKDPLDWLSSLYDQLADSALRRYPTWIRAADSIAAEPERAAAELAAFRQADIDTAPVELAFAQLTPPPARHSDDSSAASDDSSAVLLDEVYAALRDGSELSDALVARVNDVLAIGALRTRTKIVCSDRCQPCVAGKAQQR